MGKSTENLSQDSSTEKSNAGPGRGLLWDFVFGGLAYLVLLIIDPWFATTIGVPVCVALFVLRNRFWPDRPVLGGLVVGFNAPFVVAGIACLIAFGSLGMFLGPLGAFAVICVAEVLNRRQKRSFVRRFTLLTGIFFFVLNILITAFVVETGLATYPTEEIVKSVSMAPPAPRWKEDSKADAVRAVYSVVDARAEINGLYDALKEDSLALRGEPSPNGVYVTLYDRNGYHSRGFSKGKADSLENIIVAAQDAFFKARFSPGDRVKRDGPWRSAPSHTRIQVDVVGPSQGITIRPIFYLFSDLFRGADRSLESLNPLDRLLNTSFQVEVGVDGLVVAQCGVDEDAVMLPADPVTGGWLTPRVRSAPGKVAEMLRRTFKRTHGEKLNLEEDRYEIRKFQTNSFGALSFDGEVISWLRGNVLAESALTRDALIDGIEATTGWLVRQMKPSGQFAYEKFPPYRDGTTDYNLPRHAGSLYGLFAAHRVSVEHEELKELGNSALEAGLQGLQYVGDNLGKPARVGLPGHLCFLSKKKSADSGSTALAALAIAELTRPEDVTDPALREKVAAVPKEEWLLGMGDCMLQMIDKHGAVFRGYEESVTMDVVKKEPLYYPGEVMLALSKLYRETGEERFLEGAKRIGERQLGLKKWELMFDFPVPGDHWIIQALAEVALITEEKKWAELSVLYGRGYIREQHPPQEYYYPDYEGAYRRIADLPRTTRAASRGEAIGSALVAARFLGEDASRFEESLVMGAKHLLEQTFTKESAYFVSEKHDVVGGVRMGLVDNHLRIDNNQHSLVALIRTLDAMGD